MSRFRVYVTSSNYNQAFGPLNHHIKIKDHSVNNVFKRFMICNRMFIYIQDHYKIFAKDLNDFR